MGPANLFTKNKWWPRSRLWRFIFLIDPAGFFDPSPGLAPALLAQRVRPQDVQHLMRKKAGALESLLVIAATEAELEEAENDIEGVGKTEEDLCPVTGFDHTAIEWCMPKQLQKLQRVSAAEGRTLPALRFWTTLLCACALRRLNESYLLKTRGRDGFDETIVDRCMGYITQVFEEHPQITAMRGPLLVEAELILDAWGVRHAASIKATKRAMVAQGTAVRDFLERRRLSAIMADMTCRAHETFSAVLGPPTHPLMRWQRWLVIFTLMLGVFTVDICAPRQLVN